MHTGVTGSVRRLRPAQLAAAIAMGLIIHALVWPLAAAAIDGEITSEGPLTRIIVTTDLNCQVSHQADVSFEFFGGESGACGTFLAVGGTLYAPAAVPSGGFISQPWTAVSQAAVTGSGRGGDPFRLVTVVDAGDVGLRVEQTDSYQVGEESYRTDIRISNSGGGEQRAILYRAADCYLQDSDSGFGRVDDGAPACVISQADDARIEQWVPLTGGSRYFEGGFSDVWQRISAQEPFPNECLCDAAVDNGAGLSWEVAIPAGGSVDVSHLTFFSPEGRSPASSLRASVPGPLDISLDPVVIASSAVIATGVVVFVPFPAALFNSTLQEHYAEVTGAVARFRRWLSRLVMLVGARIGRAIGTARARRRADAPVPPPQAEGEQPAAQAGQRFSLDEAFWRSPIGILAFVAVSALINGLLDPTFGFSATSMATYLGLALGMGVLLLAFGIPMFIATRGLGVRLSVRALPGTLLIAVISVVISRVADFQPGYLYGLIIGFTFSRALSNAEGGRVEAFAAGSALALAIASWLLLPLVRGGDGGQSFMAVVLETTFATLVVAGLEAAAIAMLPMRFLPGERVRAWNQRAWIGLLGIATFGFCHILLNPSSGYLADSTRTSLFTVIWLLVAFGGGSVLFWAYFRFRPQRGGDAPPPSPMPSAEPPTTA